MSSQKPILYSYFRSSCSMRLRFALNLKGIDYEIRPVNLLKGEQLEDGYSEINPNRTVPTLIIDGNEISQSVAAMEYIEETRSEPPLLPKDPAKRAQVRTIINIIAGDTQPLQNLKVVAKMNFSSDEERMKYTCDVITRGLSVAEKYLEKSSGKFCVGDEVTLADCTLIAQLPNAYRFGVDMDKFPLISAIEKRTSEIEAFKRGSWKNQPDCPQELRE